MAQFNGKWKLTSTKGVMPLMESIGVSGDNLKEVEPLDDINNDLVDEILVTETECVMAEIMKGEELYRWKRQLNKEIKESEAGLEYTVKVYHDEKGLHILQKGDGYTCIYTRQLKGKHKLTLEMCSTDSKDLNKKVEAFREYVKIE